MKPGPYGIRQPLYFPFLPSYWIGHKVKAEEVIIAETNLYDTVRLHIQ